MSDAQTAVAGIVLAGGKSSRMGRDKAVLPVAGEPLIHRIVARLASQVDAVAIGANRDGAYFGLDLPILADAYAEIGPLGGILAGLRWAWRQPSASHLLTVSCDSPFFPADLRDRLSAAARKDDADIVAAESGGRIHPTFALLSLKVTGSLENWLEAGSDHSVRRWMAQHRFTTVAFDGSPDPFMNLNTPEDVRVAEALLHKPRV